MPYIDLNTVSLSFPIYGTSKRLFKKELVRMATGGLLKKNASNLVMVDALKDLTLHIHEGMRLGLIGHNGAGKSTLLRVIAGIYHPSSGVLKTSGKVSPILDVMVGIDDDSTGYESIHIRALLQGLSRKEISDKKKEIAAFTELGDYLWMPVRTYSAGMKMRLAFGIATCVVPEILVIDEIFNAGDASIIEKSQARMREMIYASKVVVFTSHRMDLIRNICTHTLWLDRGQAKFFGPVEEGIERYHDHLKKERVYA